MGSRFKQMDDLSSPGFGIRLVTMISSFSCDPFWFSSSDELSVLDIDVWVTLL